MQSLSNLSNLLPSRRYALPDKAVASQVLMYRQLLHTECKPGLRLSRNYEGTDAQKKVKHMPWWEQGVETSRKMVISYDNLIVRLWLNGAIMPYTDGGYAEQHSNCTVPKDDVEHEDMNDALQKEVVGKEGHIDTLIDSKGLPPIPHAYWVDRLGFQQTDPQTDFRSGGVLSLAMLVHIVEACPNVHARFLPSGDAHMLPFGITCINVTDMIAKFCMLSKSFDRMDALLSQKPFWKMFENPDCLLVLQELSMEILCNVVVELKRERKFPKEDNHKDKDKDKEKGPGFDGQEGQADVSVFDFAEILYKTEKRVNDDLLGSGPRTVDELRANHTRNCTKYMKAIDKKEQQALKAYERSKAMGSMPTLSNTGNDRFAALASASNTTTEAAKSLGLAATDVFGKTSGVATSMIGKTSGVATSMIGKTGGAIGSAGNVANNIIKDAGSFIPGNVKENAGGMLNKFKGFSMRPMTPVGKKTGSSKEQHEIEEVDFAKPPSQQSDGGGGDSVQTSEQTSAPAATFNDAVKSPLDEAEDLMAFLDVDADSKTEMTKKEFEDLLGDPTANQDATDYFTIDDDDLL